MIEIERKFLVKSDRFKAEALTHYTITQGFLNTNPSRTVRVRLKEDTGFITIKGKSSADGLERFEWEKKISKVEAEALLALCEPSIIHKIRYEVPLGKHVFEIDEFLGDNTGLIIAEIELKSKNESYKIPPWLGKEVTGQIQYYNSALSKVPFTLWT